MTKKICVGVISDTHINHKTSPAVSFTTEKGDTYKPTKTQRELVRFLEAYADEFARREADEKILVLNGDLIEMDDKQRTWAIISRNPADMLDLAHAVLKPLIEIADKVMVIRGTPSHL